MKLELKHLAPYLPYGLKGVLTEDKVSIFHDEIWSDDESIFQPNAVWKLCGYAEGDLNIPLGEGCFDGFLWRNGYTYVNFHRGIEPILRPLSDLTKEIEHNGEKFVPMDILCNEFSQYDCFEFDNVNILNNPYNQIQNLLEWHFDIYGLIENGLAIDINTLEK